MSEARPKQISPVEVRYTNNPEDRDVLLSPTRIGLAQVSEKLRLVISKDGLTFFGSAEVPLRQYAWSQVLEVASHDLSDPPHVDPETPNLPCCGSCGSYYYRSDEVCETCALLSITDPLGVYASFRYGLHFSDRYYREAFLKWAKEFMEDRDNALPF